MENTKNMPSEQKRLTYTTNRTSFFDITEPNAPIHKCEMKGFYIMIVLLVGYYILISCYIKFMSEGSFFEQTFFENMVRDGKLVVLIWPCVFLYSWIAFFHQRLILAGLPHSGSWIIQHSSQSLMFLVTSYLVLTRDWGFTQTIFITFLCFTHFMKMHSYTQINRDLREEWLKNPKDSAYPKNITFYDYLMYMVRPVLVYQTSYPSIPKFRISYFLKKCALLSVQIITLYICISDHILPIINERSPLFISWMKLAIPCLVTYWLVFFITFEQILNLFAELSLFGDREFYQDWWNSNTFADFSRKWNRPVHQFLYKHVYLEAKERWGLTEKNAAYFTYFFSSLCHEMVVALVCKTIRPYLLGLMMFQIPLVLIAKVGGKEFGLYLFWTGIITGPPLLCTLYSISSFY
ncbi:unnamed protein product [Blepharisma stoltei]|uniref:O-acyltransferase n=1 Tax=Blepharisma stoltei TaxID=1481888 RepID=A0AAU9J596_9CILI|nr:unnamed protein product [Blepharisma stoltei]